MGIKSCISARSFKVVRELLNGEFPSGDLHHRHTGDLADPSNEVLIFGRDNVDAVFRYLVPS